MEINLPVLQIPLSFSFAWVSESNRRFRNEDEQLELCNWSERGKIRFIIDWLTDGENALKYNIQYLIKLSVAFQIKLLNGEK